MMDLNFNRLQKKWLSAFLLCLLCWWAFFVPATCTASAPPENQTVVMYQITESELTTLENNLVQLSAINSRLQADLKVQSSEATALKQEVIELKKQLEQLRNLSQTQESSLTNANKLLAEYATEVKRERLRIKAQRNTWEAVAACLVVALIAK